MATRESVQVHQNEVQIVVARAKFGTGYRCYQSLDGLRDDLLSYGSAYLPRKVLMASRCLARMA